MPFNAAAVANQGKLLEVYTTKLITKSFSLFALLLFSLSLFMTPPVANLSTDESITQPVSYSVRNPRTLADYPTDFTRVDWDLGTVNNYDPFEWNSSHYRFGPTVNWHTRNTTDSSLITWNDEIAIDEYVDFRIEIPFSSLGGQTPAGVYLMGQYFNMSALANSEGEFRTSDNSPNMWMVYYEIARDRWLYYSTTNATWPQGAPTGLDENFTIADVFGTEVSPYLEFNPAYTGYNPTLEAYWANVRVRFNSSIIGGFYTISCGVQDAQFAILAESRFEEFNSGRILGTTFDFLVDQAVGGYYAWERVSDDGSTLLSATRGVDFNMTATIVNGTSISNVTVLFDIPETVRTQQLVYGPYVETSEVTGVWEYDNVSQAYIWNEAKTVNWTAQKEGFHHEDGFTYLDTRREYQYWDGWGWQQDWSRGMAAIVYDFQTDTFSTVLAYNYKYYEEVVTEKDTYWQKYYRFEFEPWPMDGSLPLPYIVDELLSESYVKDGKFVVTFRGHIGDDILPTNSQDNGALHVYEIVMDIHGRNLAPQVHLPISPPELALEYEMTRDLAVESPVSIVTLTHGGEPYEPDWMFQTDVGVPFTVNSWLQGGADYFEEIDGIGFFMKAHEENWGFDGMNDWNQWSEIEVQIRIDPHGMVDVAVYNRTIRNQWVQGDYWDWVMVEVMPGRWEPQWMLIPDAGHWEEMTWDFIDQKWTPGWLSMESPNVRMPVHWLDIENLMQDLVGNDLRVTFDILPTPELPQLEWRWNYFYGELDWVVDYESGWGDHTVLGWTEDTVYSYINGTDKLHIDEPFRTEIFRNNQTGDFYQREKVPFVEIDGEIIDLEPYLITDMETNWEEIVRSEYNYTTGEEEYFIQYANGTEIQVYTGSVAVVYNITLPAQGNAWFLAWGDMLTYTGIDDLHSMLAVNGTYIVGDGAAFWNGWISNVHAVVPTTMVEHTYVSLVNGSIPIYMVGWPEYINEHHYVMYLNGTYEPVDWFWDDMWGWHYWNMTDMSLNRIEWPWELMTGTYQLKQFFIPNSLTNSHVYTLVDGQKKQLPAPGIPMWSPWELNSLEYIYDFVNQRYFAREYAIVDGIPYEAVKHPMLGWEPTFGYEYEIWQIDTGQIYNLTDWSVDPIFHLNYEWDSDGMENRPWTTIANGSIWVPDVVQEDWTVSYGHRDSITYEFIEEGSLDLQTGFYTGDYETSQIHEWDDGRGYDWVLTMGGEEFSYNKTWRATFLNITLANGTTFYSRMDHPIAEPTNVSHYEIDRYFMIDIYGMYQGWQGWMDYTAELVFSQNVLGDPDNITGQFFFEGMYRPVLSYPVSYWEWDGGQWNSFVHWEDNIVPHDYFFLQNVLNASEIYEIMELWNTPDSYKFNFPSWAFNTTVDEYHAYGAKEVIYQAFKTQGYSMKLDYTPLPVTIIQAQEAILYGTPARGMWEHDVWTVNPANGALDLDGNLDTTIDQFYVREIHSSSDYFNITQQYLDVTILWDPDNSTWADEFYLHSYTGMVTFNWTYDWSQDNVWTHTDGTSLTPVEYGVVQDILFDAFGNPEPGYWGIAWMFENRTYTDMLTEAQTEGWDWVEDNSQEWSWLWWELDEHYSSEVSFNETYSELMDVNLAYQYAGMFAWNDTSQDNFMNISAASLSESELTHYWMPVDVESVNFTTPGKGWGNLNTTDSEYRPVNETIDFGVTFTNVTGEVYPFGDRTYFDWYEDAYYGSDFEDFDERPTECLTEEFSIDVHFTGDVNETDSSGIAAVKFDITVGDWEMYTPGGDNVLEGRSLAVAFYSDLSIMTSGGTATNTTYFNDAGDPVTNDQAEASYNFTMGMSNMTDVALMSLGGAPYSWSRNTSMATTVDAQTVPLSAFSAIYVSGGGHTATTFSIASSQFFTVIGFPQWDGWAVTVDPIFVGYISPGTTDVIDPTFGTTLHAPVELMGVDNVHIQATVSDSGGSDLAEVKVWETGGNNYSMTFNEGMGVWEVNIPRTSIPGYTEGRFDFDYRIVAIDNAGNEAITSEQTFHFRDNIPPSIDSMGLVNGTDVMGDEIATVTVTASDLGDSGIDRVVLTYQNTSGQYNVTMPFSTGSYSGEIPNHASGTIVQYGVTVYDVDGNLDWSGWDTFTFYGADLAAPSVTLVAHDPISPGSSDSVTVSADIQDVSGVTSAVLQYRVDSGVWNNVTMSSVGTTYTGVIPAQADGASVAYRIVAYDTLGNEAITGETTFTVEDVVTTPTTPTEPTTTEPTPTRTGPVPQPGDDEKMLMVYGAFGALVVLVIALSARKRK